MFWHWVYWSDNGMYGKIVQVWNGIGGYWVCFKKSKMKEKWQDISSMMLDIFQNFGCSFLSNFECWKMSSLCFLSFFLYKLLEIKRLTSFEQNSKSNMTSQWHVIDWPNIYKWIDKSRVVIISLDDPLAAGLALSA